MTTSQIWQVYNIDWWNVFVYSSYMYSLWHYVQSLLKINVTFNLSGILSVICVPESDHIPPLRNHIIITDENIYVVFILYVFSIYATISLSFCNMLY